MRWWATAKLLVAPEVWDDVPEELRPAAATVMQAHLGKLKGEGRVPPELTP